MPQAYSPIRDTLSRTTMFLAQSWPVRGPETLGALNDRAMLMKVNVVLQMVTTKRKERMALLEAMFGRPFTSSKELTLAEAKALLITSGYDYTIPEQPIEPAFLDFMRTLKEESNAQPAQ